MGKDTDFRSHLLEVELDRRSATDRERRTASSYALGYLAQAVDAEVWAEAVSAAIADLERVRAIDSGAS